MFTNCHGREKRSRTHSPGLKECINLNLLLLGIDSPLTNTHETCLSEGCLQQSCKVEKLQGLPLVTGNGEGHGGSWWL